MGIIGILLAVSLLSLSKEGIDFQVESDADTINPANSVFLTLKLTAQPAAKVTMPDLRERVVGFSLAEEFAEEPQKLTDGRVKQVVNWKLVPKPCETEYKIRPFAIGENVAGPIYFKSPLARDPVTGEMEVDVRKDLPPLSWRLVGWCILGLLAVVIIVGALIWGLKVVSQRIKEHRMSPIERAWVELERLIRKGLPGRGRYKDFYVELTMVVRRYVQRKYGIRAPHLTTEEFLKEVGSGASSLVTQHLDVEALRTFLESADMVKFAGVEATPEMADAATDSARGYLKRDNTNAPQADKQEPKKQEVKL